MKKYFILIMTLFVFLFSGCGAEKENEIEYEILYKVQRTKENYYEIPFEIENVITYISSYDTFQELFFDSKVPLDKLYRINDKFFEENILIFIDFCAEETIEADSLNIERITMDKKNLYIHFIMNGYRNQGLEGNRFGVDYFISIKKSDIKNLEYAKMMIENKYHISGIQEEIHSEINNSDSYHVVDGETVGRIKVSPDGEYIYDFPTYALII